MKRFLQFLGVLLVVVIVLVLGRAATMPEVFSIEESISVAAPVDKVFPQIADLKNWEGWSPWKAKDPSIENTYSEVTDSVGATQSWTSKDSGSGTLQLTGLEPNEIVEYKLIFKEWESETDGFVKLEPETGATKITWVMKGQNTFADKVFWVVFRLESAIRKDFQFGLGQLKKISENTM